MSAKPLLFAPQHLCWKQRAHKEKQAAFGFHDQELYKTFTEGYPR